MLNRNFSLISLLVGHKGNRRPDNEEHTGNVRGEPEGHFWLYIINNTNPKKFNIINDIGEYTENIDRYTNDDIFYSVYVC